ncbi:BgTH12-00292 [Blumeria graminis f. sp. triticale]|uniref:Vacuolar membrane-associated protein IML1 n=3 Tax=Blumeria graminis TaxID=34373 RepID=A0A061HPI7_BLUGR|nr:hypothetical protein BGT96224_534 [Blumeria graminis f. sp. tritici 96224]CAD6504789.1 BgTH12-00292 [Blumeria graminis f. sp. triticale]VDB92813.1 Bgt-534 [Blumeria graminis f. sp. tritici]
MTVSKASHSSSNSTKSTYSDDNLDTASDWETGKSRPITISSNANALHGDQLKADLQFKKKCILWVHEEGFSRDDVVLNVELFRNINPGDLLTILPWKSPFANHIKATLNKYVVTEPVREQAASSNPSSLKGTEKCNKTLDFDIGNQFIFVVKDTPKDIKSDLQISVSKHVADLFNLKHRSNVLVTSADANDSSASHVELSFKDEYLARSDMWRLTVSELSGKTVYHGQKVLFMGSIKAQVTAIHRDNRKVQSAYFSIDTKPIFRSCSARYTLFIQMSREMWDFDYEGSGEIMFNQVINGFLPGLFKRWAALKFEHLVSIVLFARVEYDTGITQGLASETHSDSFYTGIQPSGSRRPYKDFYRVVVYEMSSGSWTTILYQLKLEFKFFRKDILTHHLKSYISVSKKTSGRISNGASSPRIEAESSLAMYGNLLEAINLSCSQFSYENIDRDLMRTGVSILFITPCAGLFEVDFQILKMTAEMLSENSISIELVCLPRMPLHLTPLFRYRNPKYDMFFESLRLKTIRNERNTLGEHGIFSSSFSSIEGSFSPSKPSRTFRNLRIDSSATKPPEEWVYAKPSWINISFWTGPSYNEDFSKVTDQLNSKNLCGIMPKRASDFAVRCKMYEMEMTGTMESILTEISISPLDFDPLFSQIVSRPRQKVLGKIIRKKPFRGLSELSFSPSRALLGRQTSQEKNFQQIFENYDTLVSQAPRGQSSILEREDIRRQVKHESTGILHDLTTTGSDLIYTPGLGRGSGSNVPYTASNQKTKRKKQRYFTNYDEQEARKFAKDNFLINNSTSMANSKTYLTKHSKPDRQISLGMHGFGIASPKAVIAKPQTEHANASKPRSSSKSSKNMENMLINSSFLPHNLSFKSLSAFEIPSSRSKEPQYRPNSNPKFMSDSWNLKKIPLVRPMTIKGSTESPFSNHQHEPQLGRESSFHNSYRNLDFESFDAVKSFKEYETQRPNNPKLIISSFSELNSTLSPTSALLPCPTILNPSNLSIESMSDLYHYKQWQHTPSRFMQKQPVKWKSLSSPASIPLTTDAFPTKYQLDTDYQQKPYNISQNLDDDFNEAPKKREGLIRELVGLRLSQGFQIVTGPLVAEAFGQKALKMASVFDQNQIAEDGVSIYMSMGSTIHQLSCVNDGEVEINIFVRKPNQSSLSNQGLVYNPAIRTSFAQTYESQSLTLGKRKDDYNWNYVDAFLGGYNEDMSDKLRFWCARFVLIPVERPSHAIRRQGEDSEEEIRLEGIKRLTQMWQRHRVLTPNESRFQTSSFRKTKDPNPLDIVYKTEDPSNVVTAELETLPLVEVGDLNMRKSQLLETERFKKSKLDIAALAEAIQAPVEKGGVRMQNRRWHLRLHHNCFIGSDMATWLIDNFEDIETREEAVELGNKLMLREELLRSRDKDKEKEMGLFVHVEKRHLFRDGQYFYQLTGEFAKQVPDNRSGWFSSKRRDTSIPPTPLGECMWRDAQRSEQSRTSSNYDEKCSPCSSITQTFSCGGKRPRVFLSKVMKYDVDHRKRSYRPEIINLHYDRLHNPDNCYHIRIDWMGVTAKLIKDAIESWATVADRYGLRLVEVPIGEAQKINSVNPFRRPYHMELVVQPPNQQLRSLMDINCLSSPSNSTPSSRNFYQKSILKKFNFVLDIEAAKNFPSNVDVLHSWGKPDYQYSQYIHRSGVMLAQITDEGNFLLLANRVYSNKTVTPKDEGQITFRQVDNSTPRSILNELQVFCNDGEALKTFYQDVYDRMYAPFANTSPCFRSTSEGLHDYNISTLRLPPSLVVRNSGSNSRTTDTAPVTSSHYTSQSNTGDWTENDSSEDFSSSDTDSSGM